MRKVIGSFYEKYAKKYSLDSNLSTFYDQNHILNFSNWSCALEITHGSVSIPVEGTFG